MSSLPQIRCSFLSFIITDDTLEMTVLFNIKRLRKPVAA